MTQFDLLAEESRLVAGPFRIPSKWTGVSGAASVGLFGITGKRGRRLTCGFRLDRGFHFFQMIFRRPAHTFEHLVDHSTPS